MTHNIDSDASPTLTEDVRVPFFALVVGINDYQNLRKLGGAVADANAIATYLEYHLGIPKDQIINLRDKAATREGIIGGFRSLQNNPDIQHGDAIMIYYAGHGGEVDTPSGWEAGGDKIQVMLPQDATNGYTHPGQIIPPIPDRTVAGLLNDLAEEKGNNITVVFDCCHSVSGSRDDMPAPGGIARVVEVKYGLPSELDHDIHVKRMAREVYIPSGFLQRDLRSHVFLAACGAEELAWERGGRGVFTKALLDALTSVKVDSVTYIDLMHRLSILPQQNPQCEGFHKSRFLFNAKIPGTAPYFIDVELGADSSVLKAGIAQGITIGSEFSVHAHHIDDPKSNPVLCTLRVKDTGLFLATLEPFSDTLQCSLPTHAYARLLRSGGQGLRVHFSDALLHKFGVSRQAVLERCTDIGLLPVIENEAYIAVTLDDDDRTKMVFSINDSLVANYGLRRLPHLVPAIFDNMPRVLRAAARWKWHLQRQPNLRPFSERVHMVFTRLEIANTFDQDGSLSVLRPVGEDLNATGVVDLVVNPDHLFGIKIVNGSKRDLYSYLFYFDVNNQRIESFYDGPIGGGKADPSLRAGASLTIGYGAGGTPPIAFSLRDAEEIDIGFLKLFLATSPIDLSSLEQSPPFFDERALLPQTDVARSLSNLEQWDTVMMTIVQRTKPRALDTLPIYLASAPAPAPAPAPATATAPAPAPATAPTRTPRPALARRTTLKWLWLFFRDLFTRFFLPK